MAKSKTEEGTELSVVDAFKNNLVGKLGAGIKKSFIDPLNIVYERFPSGSYLLDDELKGGYVKGKHVELFGNEATGKSTLCAEAVTQFQKKYPKEMVMWFDLENVLDGEYFNNIGVNINPDKFILMRPDTGEEVFEMIREFAKSFKGGLIIIDSVPLMVPETTMEADFNQANVAAQARLMSKGMEGVMAHLSKADTTVFFINQLRVNIGNTYGDPNVTKGGNALKYYVRTRIKTSRQNAKGIAGESSGNTFELVKANYGNEKKKVETRIVYGQGIDKISELIDFCSKIDVFEKSGSWFSYKGTKLANGKNAFIEVLKDNVELYEELEEVVRTHIKNKYEK